MLLVRLPAEPELVLVAARLVMALTKPTHQAVNIKILVPT